MKKHRPGMVKSGESGGVESPSATVAPPSGDYKTLELSNGVGKLEKCNGVAQLKSLSVLEN